MSFKAGGQTEQDVSTNQPRVDEAKDSRKLEIGKDENSKNHDR